MPPSTLNSIFSRLWKLFLKVRLRSLSVIAQALFLGILQHYWSFSEIGVYMTLLSLFNLSTLLSSSGVEKQIIRRRATGLDDKVTSDLLVDRIATQAIFVNIVFAVAMFGLFYQKPIGNIGWVLILFSVGGMALRTHAAKIEEPARFVDFLDWQLRFGIQLRLALALLVAIGLEPMQILLAELLAQVLGNLIMCHRYALVVRVAFGGIGRKVLSQIGLMFVSKLLQQLGVRYLLLIPASQSDFTQAGIFGFLQKVCALITNIADFLLQRLHVTNGLFETSRALGISYHRRFRSVLIVSCVLATVFAMTGVMLAGGSSQLMWTSAIVMTTPPLLVWRAGLSNAISQKQSYWISPASYLLSILLFIWASLFGISDPLGLAGVLLANVLLNVITAKLLLIVT